MQHAITSLALCVSLLSGAAAVQSGHAAPNTAPSAPVPTEQPKSAEARARHPQPVLVGSLAGRQLIANTAMQRVLGRVVGAVRSEDKVDRLLIDRGGVLGLGKTRVTVPVAAMTLLGDLVALHDLTPAALAALPEVTRPEGTLLPGATIQIGLARN